MYSHELSSTMTILVAVVIVFLIGGCDCQIWTAHNASSVWNCQTVRKHVNNTLTAETYNVASLAGCAHQCANTTPSAPQTGVDFLSLYYDVEARRCYCNPDVDTTTEDETQPAIKYCSLKISLKMDKTADHYTRSLLWPYQHDCTSLYNFYQNQLHLAWEELHLTKAGVHAIYPDGEGPVDVWCDMKTIGYTVIQKRLGGAEKFNRIWSEYVNGFGDTTGEYWLGLKNIHLLTKVDNMRLQIKLEPSDESNSQNATLSHILQYFRFTVGSESSNYALQHQTWNGYTVNDVYDAYEAYDVPDIFHGQLNIPFSTPDNDNDDSEQNLAAVTQSGWWIGSLAGGNLNIPYVNRGGNSSTGQLFYWPLCKGLPGMNVSKTTMRFLHADFFTKRHESLICRI